MMDVVSLSRLLYKGLRSREKELVEAVAYGAPSNWDSYQAIVGEIRGLAFAIDELKALLERTTDDVEETLSSGSYR